MGLDVYNDKPEDHCGVLGISANIEVSPLIHFGLRALQHRGQESAGIATFGMPETDPGAFDSPRIMCHKGMGLVHEAFGEHALSKLVGRSGIGHVRYSTTGSSRIENAQPIVVLSQYGDIAVAHNGDLVNTAQIRTKLQEAGWAFVTTTDTEIILRLLVSELTHNTNGNIVKGLQNVMAQIEGSYSLVFLIAGRVLGVRDPLGIKPLCIGRLPDGKGYAIASESVAFDSLGGEFVRDVSPGEIVEVAAENALGNPASESAKVGIVTHYSPKCERTAHCMFEWVYFARPDSIIDGLGVYAIRQRIGRLLAKEKPVEADIIVPIPDSGRSHAIGFSEASGIRYTEGLMKNRYTGRTFIIPSKEMRLREIKLKLNPIKLEVAGKRIVLVDDSIVRGTTITRIVEMMREAGAKEVHVRVGSPPIISPCYFGIDMKKRDQFIARGHTEDEVAKIIKADSVGYISIEKLVEAIGIPKAKLCTGCLDRQYPIRIPDELLRAQGRIEDFQAR